MTDLIERLAAAKGGDRELDAAIATQAGWDVRYDRNDPEPYYQPVPEYSWQKVLPYTASVDAALTLVPEGWTTHHYGQGPSGKPHTWNLCCIRDGEQRYTHTEGRAPTPALALCIAALQARNG